MSNPETRLQLVIVKALRQVLRPPAYVLHVKNEGRYDGDAKRRAELGDFWRRMGLQSGAPDLLIGWPGGVGWLELKAEAGRLSPSQIDFHPVLTANGQPVAVVRTLDEALAAVTAWGVPTRLAEQRLTNARAA